MLTLVGFEGRSLTQRVKGKFISPELRGVNFASEINPIIKTYEQSNLNE